MKYPPKQVKSSQYQDPKQVFSARSQNPELVKRWHSGDSIQVISAQSQGNDNLELCLFPSTK